MIHEIDRGNAATMYGTDGLFGTMPARVRAERRPAGQSQPREVLVYDRLKMIHPRLEITWPEAAREVTREG